MSMILVVHFRHNRNPYTHAVGGEREAQDTINGWTRAGGLWIVSVETRRRAWIPWHSINEIELPVAANLPMVVRHPSNPVSKPQPRGPFKTIAPLTPLAPVANPKIDKAA